MKTSDTINHHRARHHAALSSLVSNPTQAGLPIWRKLRRIECRANQAATAYCNGETYATHHSSGSRVYDFRRDEYAWDAFVTREVMPAVACAFGGRIPAGFFVNGDPRGYALKIDPERGTVPDGMHTDWGRYGILAPEID